MKNASHIFLRDKQPIYVKPGQMIKSASDQLLAVKLLPQSVCVVFSGVYVTGGGLPMPNRDICLVHWNKNNASDQASALTYLLRLVTHPSDLDPTNGMFGYQDVNICIISHPQNDAELKEEVLTELASVSSELKLSKKHLNNKHELNKNSIQSYSKAQFVLNSHGQVIDPPADKIADKNEVCKQNAAVKKPSYFESLLNKFRSM